ncbi:MAG TPA: SRPBCC family protein [Actinomycetota bacterium]|nr:SRPBCC family protein [Actinomycetota bacterium]
MSDLKVVADPGTHEIVITRSFDAPRDLVFKAFTDPEAVGQWWGLDSTETVVDQLEARPGGRWRFVGREGDGSEYGFHGVYHDLQDPERIVYTFEFEGMPGHVLLETIVFEDQDGRTLMTDTSVFQSVADRDGMLKSGMESGAAESLDRLEAYLAKR